MENGNDITLDELMKHIEEMEESVRVKNEAVFQRVLDSLGGPMDPNKIILSHEAVHILNESKMRRDQQKLEQQKRLDEERERKHLEEERERLRKRFDQDSEDAVGENPLPNLNNDSLIDLDVATSVDQVTLHSVFESEEFDVMLSELEKELDAQAVGKDDGAVTELGEILSYLDEEASKKKKVPLPTLPPPSQPSAFPPTPPAALSASVPSKYALSNPNYPAHLPTGPTPNQAIYSASGGVSAPAAQQGRPFVAASRGGRGAGRAGGPQPSARSQDNEKGIEESEDDDEDEDDDELWQKKRSAYKSHHEGSMVHTSSETRSYAVTRSALGTRADFELEQEISRPSRYKESEEEEEEDEEEIQEEGRSTIEGAHGSDTSPPPTSSPKSPNIGTPLRPTASTTDVSSSPASPAPMQATPPSSPTRPSINNADIAPTLVRTPTPTSAPATQSDSSPSSAAAAVVSSGSLLSGSLAKAKAPTGTVGRGKRGVLGASRTTAGASASKPSHSEAEDQSKLYKEDEEVSAPPQSSKTDAANVNVEVHLDKQETEIPAQTPSSSIAAVTPSSAKPPAPTHISLDGALDAPYLFPFPVHTFVDKAKGQVLNFSPAHAHVHDESAQYVDLPQVVCLSVHPLAHAHTHTVGSQLLAYTVQQVRAHGWEVCGLCMCGEEEGEERIYLVCKCSGDVFVNNLKHTLDNADLRSVYSGLPGESEDSLTIGLGGGVTVPNCALSALIQVFDYATHPERVTLIIQKVGAFCVPSVPVSAHIHSASVCAVAFKSYVHAEGLYGALHMLVRRCEEQGGRVLALRLAHVHDQDAYSLKKYVSHDIAHTSSPAAGSPCIPLLCVLLAHCRGDAEVSSSVYSGGEGGCSAMVRDILGPADSALAKVTDPASLRAQHGEGKERNVCYGVSVYKENVFKEVCVYFGDRQQRGIAPIVSQQSAPIVLPAARGLRVGISVGIAVHEFSPHMASAMQHQAQSLALDLLHAQLLGTATLKGLALLTHAQFESLGGRGASASVGTLRATSPHADDAQSASAPRSHWSCVLELHTCVSSVYMQALWAKLVSMLKEIHALTPHLLAEVFLQEIGDGEAEEADGSADAHSSTQQTHNLSLHQALQQLAKEGGDVFKSHADAGMYDAVELTVASAQVQTHPTSPLHIFHLLLHHLPATCHTHLIGVRRSSRSEEDGASVPTWHILLRGFQLLEHIYHTLSDIHTQHGIQCSVSKGRKLLETVVMAYPPSSLYLDIALYDLYVSLPFSHTLLTCNRLVQAPPSSLSLYQLYHIQDYESAYDHNQHLSMHAIAHALFPPPSPETLHVLVIPYTTNGAAIAHTLRAARILRALGKSSYRVIGVECVGDLPPHILDDVYVDNMHQFNNGRSNILAPARSPPSPPKSPPTSVLTHAQNHAGYMLLLVQNKAASRRLRDVLGPVFDRPLALASYPSSLAASLGVGEEVMVYGVYSCRLVESMVNLFFPSFAPVLHRLQRRADGDASASHSIPSPPSSSSSSLVKMPYKVMEKAHLPPQSKSSSLASSAISPSHLQDLACVVLTSQLWGGSGSNAAGESDSTTYLADLFDALHRDSIAIVNATTAMLTPAQAKHIYASAGQSSLTLRPATPYALTLQPPGQLDPHEGRVLCLGLYGSAHSMVRLHSLKGETASDGRTLWQLSNGEVGALASSSSRLGRELYCQCFERIFGDDVVFEVVVTADEV